MVKQILMILTNHDQLGNSGKQTGWYLPEVAHPYEVFVDAGYEVVFVSPKGGKAPMDQGSFEAFKEDPVCKKFLENKEALSKIDSTLKPSDVQAETFPAVFYAGGHGPMWDVTFDQAIADLSSKVYLEGKGVLAAVCHGTCGLLPVKDKSGKEIISGKKVTSFTNKEEELALGEKEAWQIMNFKLQSKLSEVGAEFVEGDPFKCNAVCDARIVTGQNPQSATKAAELVIEALKA